MADQLLGAARSRWERNGHAADFSHDPSAFQANLPRSADGRGPQATAAASDAGSTRIARDLWMIRFVDAVHSDIEMVQVVGCEWTGLPAGWGLVGVGILSACVILRMTTCLDDDMAKAKCI